MIGRFALGASTMALAWSTGAIAQQARPVQVDPAAAQLHANPEPTTATTDEIVVTGIRGSLNSARNIKRNSVGVVDAIVAEDIGKLPDANIAEAAQRIPGVQLQRYEQQGASIAIRGLKQNKIVLNGREAYGSSAYSSGEYNGRNFDLQDIPSDVLAGIEISKTAAPGQIEGGLGGYVNIKTRRPFDFPGFKATLSVKGTYTNRAGGFSGKANGEVSGLVSDRWKTAIGEMGLLLNVAHSDSTFGSLEDEVQRTEAVADYADTGKTVIRPIGMFTGNGHNGSRTQDSIVAAYDWRVTDGLRLYADYDRIRFNTQRTFQTARFYVGQPTNTFSLYDGTNNLKSGNFTNNYLTDTSVVGDEIRHTDIYAGGAEWNDGGPFTAKLDISHNDTRVINTLFEWGTNVNVPTMTLGVNTGRPSTVAIGGVDLGTLSNYVPQYLLAINFNGTQRDTAIALDTNYKFGDGIFRSIDVGFRYGDYERHSFGFVSFYGISRGPATFAQISPDLIEQIPAKQSIDIGSYYTFSRKAVRDQAALRSLFGLPASESYTPDNDQLNNERTTAGYGSLNYGFDLFGQPITGNVGVRVVHTDTFGASYGADETGAFIRQTSNTSRTDALPSINLKYDVTSKFVARFGASRTVGPVNFAYLNPALTILSPVQLDAQRGNPNLKPYTSNNYDVSLEYYFAPNAQLSLGLFKKDVNGFIQTVVERDQIKGQTYNVSTYASSGVSSIKGVEAAFQDFFTFLPAPFDGLGVQANYTYVDSKAPSAIPGQTVPLEGLSKHSFNLVGIYEKGPIGVRLAYNYRSEFVVTTSSSGAQGVPIYSAPVGTLDLSISYDVSKKLSVTLEAVNLNSPSSEQYYGNPQNQMNYQPLNKLYSMRVQYAF